jgi:hypothetical protein
VTVVIIPAPALSHVELSEQLDGLVPLEQVQAALAETIETALAPIRFPESAVAAVAIPGPSVAAPTPVAAYKAAACAALDVSTAVYAKRASSSEQSSMVSSIGNDSPSSTRADPSSPHRLFTTRVINFQVFIIMSVLS